MCEGLQRLRVLEEVGFLNGNVDPAQIVLAQINPMKRTDCRILLVEDAIARGAVQADVDVDCVLLPQADGAVDRLHLLLVDLH